METFYRFFKRYQRITGGDFYQLAFPARREEGEIPPGGDPLLVAVAEHRAKFLEDMDDDFNTGGAIGVLFELVRRLNKYVDDEKLDDQKQRTPEKIAAIHQGTKTLRELGATLGLFRKPPRQQVPDRQCALTEKLLKLLIEVRAEARKAKNFAMADRIRNSLVEIGVVLEDRPGGTEWTIQQ